ncbi:STAS domain-containing protein [Enhygromyxa salina]|nr:STAS domain-containing protein [Enhygromyxa salina]
MDATPQHNLPSINVQGVGFEWDTSAGLVRVFGMPVLTMWIESSLVGMMLGMQRMVGTERFKLCMQSGGIESIDGDWGVISSAPSFEAGFEALGSYAVTCGWGEWTLHSLDRDKHKAVFRVRNNFEALYQKALGVDWGTDMTGGKFAGFCARLFGVDCWATQTRFQARGDEFDEIHIAPSSVSLADKFNQLLHADSASAADLAVALKRLEDENLERKRAEREAQERLSLIEDLSAPILEVWDGVLALPILGSLSGDRASTLMERLLQEVQRTQANYVILDLTGVEIVDTHTADYILKVARSAELLGAQCIITGIRPAVAQTMVALQANLADIVTRATLRHGLKYCMSARARD